MDRVTVDDLVLFLTGKLLAEAIPFNKTIVIGDLMDFIQGQMLGDIKFYGLHQDGYPKVLLDLEMVLNLASSFCSFEDFNFEFPLIALQFAELLDLKQAGKLTGKQIKDIYTAIKHTSILPSEYIATHSIERIQDQSKLEALVLEVITQNPKQAEGYRKGKTILLDFFVGQCMRATKGNADPLVLKTMIKEKLC